MDRGVGLLLRAQIKEGGLTGGVPRAIAVSSVGEHEGGIADPSVTEVRIDYVQHAFSVLNQYLELARGQSHVLSRSARLD